MKNNWPTKKLTEIATIIIFATIMAVPFAYVFCIAKVERSFWDNAMGNMLATILALIVGVPIALGIDRFNLRQEDRRKLEEAKEKNQEILALIKQELVFNLDRLRDRESDPNNLPFHPYQLDIWEAFSDSGQISRIINSQILNRIASAYSIIKIERFIEKNCYLATRGAFAYSGTERATKLLLEDGRRFDKQLRENTEYAIKEIDKEINRT